MGKNSEREEGSLARQNPILSMGEIASSVCFIDFPLENFVENVWERSIKLEINQLFQQIRISFFRNIIEYDRTINFCEYAICINREKICSTLVLLIFKSEDQKNGSTHPKNQLLYPVHSCLLKNRPSHYTFV